MMQRMHGLLDNASLAVYADDTTLYTVVGPGTLSRARAEVLQSSVAHLESWGDKWRVTFEPTKSQLMTTSRRRESLTFHH